MGIKEDVEAMENRIKDLERENKEIKENIADKTGSWAKQIITDKLLIKGFCAVGDMKENGFQTAIIDLKFLENTLKALKNFGLDSVAISIKDDWPIIFRADKESNLGMVIAPRVPE